MQIKKIILIFFFLIFNLFPTIGYCEYADYVTYEVEEDVYPPTDFRSEDVDASGEDLYAQSGYYQADDLYAQSSYQDYYDQPRKKKRYRSSGTSYSSRIPSSIPPPGEKVIIVDPRVHVWGAYTASGKLVRAGLATAGGKWCADIQRGCRTKSGVFRIRSLGSSSCKSSKYPIEEGGGAPMPYCMYFNGSQGIHGSYNVVAANVSHGCVRVRVSDAEWIRFNFARVGTKVIIKPY